MTKVCTKCGEEKDLEDFYNMKTGKLGKDTYCKDCRKKISKEYEIKNRKHRNEYHLNYYHQHKTKILAKMKEKRASGTT